MGGGRATDMMPRRWCGCCRLRVVLLRSAVCLQGDPTYLIVTQENTIEKFGLNAVCTHLGCVVPWNSVGLPRQRGNGGQRSRADEVAAGTPRPQDHAAWGTQLARAVHHGRDMMADRLWRVLRRHQPWLGSGCARAGCTGGPYVEALHVSLCHGALIRPPCSAWLSLACGLCWAAGLQAENKFKCPCHGSQYNAQGKVIRGPAPLVSTRARGWGITQGFWVRGRGARGEGEGDHARWGPDLWDLCWIYAEQGCDDEAVHLRPCASWLVSGRNGGCSDHHQAMGANLC